MGSRNPSKWKTSTYINLIEIIASLAADGLVTQGTRESAAMTLTYIFGNFPSSAPKELNTGAACINTISMQFVVLLSHMNWRAPVTLCRSIWINLQWFYFAMATSQIAKFMGPTWGPPGSCRPQMGPMLAPWTLLSGIFSVIAKIYTIVEFPGPCVIIFHIS